MYGVYIYVYMYPGLHSLNKSGTLISSFSTPMAVVLVFARTYIIFSLLVRINYADSHSVEIIESRFSVNNIYELCITLGVDTICV